MLDEHYIHRLQQRLEDVEAKAARLERQLRDLNLPIFTDATRGAAGNESRIIFNSDDGQLNIDDGTNWTLPDGTTT